MRGFLKLTLILIICASIAYPYRSLLKERAEIAWSIIDSRFFAPPPCTEPISYVIGRFDKKFNISEEYFLDALAEAEAIWEKPFGKELFTYSRDNEGNILKVNLVYDYRQQATTKLKSLGLVVEENKSSYDKLKAKFETLRSQYEKSKSTFNARVSSFNQRQSKYESEVNYWNKKGGAPSHEYDRLEAERSALATESLTLKDIEKDISDMADEINALVVVLNRLVVSLNLSVEKYNTTSTARGESFEEGVYSSDGFTREIDVYEFSNREKLVRVLAHELGHALGLLHVDDPKAIMYEKNQGDTRTLTQTDLDALKAQCRES